MAMQIPLANAPGVFAIVDDADHERLAAFVWRRTTTRKPGGRTYHYAARRGDRQYMHRVVLGLTPWQKVDGQRVEVDHVSHDGLDNRRANLRPGPPSPNRAHAFKRSPEKALCRFKGVTVERKCRGRPYRAVIRCNKVKYELGFYPTAEEAARAYDAAAVRLFGASAKTNADIFGADLTGEPRHGAAEAARAEGQAQQDARDHHGGDLPLPGVQEAVPQEAARQGVPAGL